VSRPTDDAGKPGEPTPADIELLQKIAEAIVLRRMTVPAILFLESSRPLSFLGSQFLYFLEPIVRTFIKGDQYRRVAVLMEDRGNVERLLLAIESQESVAQEIEKQQKKNKKKGPTS